MTTCYSQKKEGQDELCCKQQAHTLTPLADRVAINQSICLVDCDVV